MRAAQTSDAGGGQPSVLNTALLDQYRGRKNNLLERLISAYLQEAPGFFQNLRKASECNEFNDLRLNAHALKSCSYNLGAVRLSKVCQDIESAAVGQDVGQIQSYMQVIGPEWFEAEQALRSELYRIKQTTIPQQATVIATNPTEEDWD